MRRRVVNVDETVGVAVFEIGTLANFWLFAGPARLPRQRRGASLEPMGITQARKTFLQREHFWNL